MRARIRHDKCGQLAALLGGVIVVLIAIRPVWLLGSATGSELAVGMFLTTLTFLITTPGGSRAWVASRCCPTGVDSS
jgi:uncharacterized membrane protein YkgB